MRELIESLAAEAAARPELAADHCRYLADLIEREVLSTGAQAAVPPDYIYAPARRLVVRFEQLQPEPPDTELKPWETSQPPASPVTIPFDLLVFAVSAVVRIPTLFDDDGNSLNIGGALSSCDSALDLAAVSWSVDGRERRQTNGRDATLLPLSQIAGTGAQPLAYADIYRRNQELSFRGRNLTNIMTARTPAEAAPPGWREGFPVFVELALHVVSMERG